MFNLTFAKKQLDLWTHLDPEQSRTFTARVSLMFTDDVSSTSRPVWWKRDPTYLT